MRVDRRIVSLLLWLATTTPSQAQDEGRLHVLEPPEYGRTDYGRLERRRLQRDSNNNDDEDSHEAKGDWIRGPLNGNSPWSMGQDAANVPTLSPTDTLGAQGGGRPNCPTRVPVGSNGDPHGSPDSPETPNTASPTASAFAQDGSKTKGPVASPTVDDPPRPSPAPPTLHPPISTTLSPTGGEDADVTVEGPPTAAPIPDDVNEGGANEDDVNEDELPLPTPVSTSSPTKEPTFTPTVPPSPLPTVTMQPSPEPSPAPTEAPTVTVAPSAEPSLSQIPSASATSSPSGTPTVSPAPSTSAAPSGAPTTTASPTEAPTGWQDFSQDHTRDEVIQHKCGLTSVQRTEETIAAVKEFSGESSLRSASSPAFRAYNWINRLDQMVVCPQDREELLQRYSLANFYYTLDGNGWSSCTAEDDPNDPSSCETDQLRWLSNATECEWYGLTCSEEGVLTHLELPSHGLIGTLPTELFALTNLQGLSLGHNHEISGPIPSEIAHFSQLVYVDLDENNLDGPFPNVYGIPTLQAIDINNNRLSGSIANEIAQLTNLVVLQIEHNAFTGALPVAALAALEQLVLFSSQGNSWQSSSLETLCNSVPAIRASQTPAYLQFFLADCGATCSCCSSCY